jgi:hypothetical protein
VRKTLSTSVLAAVGALALAGSASAAEDWSTHRAAQQAIVHLTNMKGGPVDPGKPAAIDSYLSTRDIDSKKPGQQSQAVATVRMNFPAGSKVNPIGTCQMWSTTKPWDLKRICAKSVAGYGWALVSGLGTSALGRLSVPSDGISAPVGGGNYNDAPVDCNPAATRAPGSLTPLDPGYSGPTDPGQYSRTYESSISYADPMAGLSCTPAGFTWVRVTGYIGTGNGAYDPVTKKIYDRTDPMKKRAAKVTDKTAIIFANDNGVSALSFAGSITKNPDETVTLSVDLPAFNSAGLKGFLPLDTDLVDFRFVTTNSKYLAAGPAKYCPRNKTVTTSTTVTFSPFPSEYSGGNTSVYAPQTINSNSTCK